MILYAIAANISSELVSSDNAISFFPTSHIEVFEEYHLAHHAALKSSKEVFVFQFNVDAHTVIKSPLTGQSYFISAEFVDDVLKVKNYSYESLQTYQTHTAQLKLLIDNLSKTKNDEPILNLAEEFKTILESNDTILLYDFYEKLNHQQYQQYRNNDLFISLEKIYQGMLEWSNKERTFEDIPRNELFYQKMKLLTEMRKVRLFMSKYVPEQMIDLDNKLPKILSLISKLEIDSRKNKFSYAVFLKDLTKFCHMIVKAFGLNAQGEPILKNRLSIADYRSEINSLMVKTDFLSQLEMLGFILLSLGVCIPTFSLLYTGGNRFFHSGFNRASMFYSLRKESSEGNYYKFI